MSVTTPSEFASTTREIISHHRHEPTEMRQAWVHMVITMLYSLGYGDGVDEFDRALGEEEKDAAE